MSRLLYKGTCISSGGGSAIDIVYDNTVSNLNSINVQNVIDEINENMTYSFITLGSPTLPIVEDATNTTEVGIKIIEWLADNMPNDLSSHKYRFTVFGVTNGSTTWGVELIYHESNTYIEASMIDMSTLKPGMFRLKRMDGADTVTPFKRGGEPKSASFQVIVHHTWASGNQSGNWGAIVTASTDEEGNITFTARQTHSGNGYTGSGWSVSSDSCYQTIVT